MPSHESIPPGYEYRLVPYIDELLKTGKWQEFAQAEIPETRGISKSGPLLGDKRAYAERVNEVLRTKQGIPPLDLQKYPLTKELSLESPEQVRLLAQLEKGLGLRLEIMAIAKAEMPEDVKVLTYKSSTSIYIPTPRATDMSYIVFTHEHKPIKLTRFTTNYELVIGNNDGNERAKREAAYKRTYGEETSYPLTSRMLYYFGENGEGSFVFQPAPTEKQIINGEVNLTWQNEPIDPGAIATAREGLLQVQQALGRPR